VLLGQRRSLQLDRVDLRGRTRPSRACLATKPGTFNERPSLLSFLFLPCGNQCLVRIAARYERDWGFDLFCPVQMKEEQD
jgi:hypothetical protein